MIQDPYAAPATCLRDSGEGRLKVALLRQSLAKLLRTVAFQALGFFLRDVCG